MYNIREFELSPRADLIFISLVNLFLELACLLESYSWAYFYQKVYGLLKEHLEVLYP